ncbi:MAG: acetyl-CoA synthetase [Candidatus Aenigmatarchaeota archaeon]|nr:MAG: acetyl-CoA synthetase [Candidatus Aenigmarchaeota archaeon]
MLGYLEVNRLLRKHGIPKPKEFVMRKSSDLPSIGFPVVMKLLSPDVIHKTDVGGVVTGIDSRKKVIETFRSFRELTKRRNFRFNGVLVQEELKGVETIVGIKKDPQFGHVLMFGLGGIFVEIMEDVSLRICPVRKSEIREMIREIKGYPLLKGFRGSEPVDEKKLVDVMKKVSVMAVEEDLKEMDINPLICNSKGCWAADVRIM